MIKIYQNPRLIENAEGMITVESIFKATDVHEALNFGVLNIIQPIIVNNNRIVLLSHSSNFKFKGFNVRFLFVLYFSLPKYDNIK